MESTTLTVKSADGIQLYANAVGDPSKPAIVFIHGLAVTALAWDLIFEDPKWSDVAYLVRYDVRGHGRSDKPTDAASWESARLAEDFDAVVKAFNLNRPFVVAWSLGCLHVADILSAHPSAYISGIIDIGGPLSMETHGWTKLSASLGGIFQSTDVELFHKTANTFVSAISPKLPFNLYQAFIGTVLNLPREVSSVMFTRTQNQEGIIRACRDDSLPILLIGGTEDELHSTKALTEVVNGLGFQKLTIVDLEGVDHMPWLSDAERFREEVLGWFKAQQV